MSKNLNKIIQVMIKSSTQLFMYLRSGDIICMAPNLRLCLTMKEKWFTQQIDLKGQKARWDEIN